MTRLNHELPYISYAISSVTTPVFDKHAGKNAETGDVPDNTYTKPHTPITCTFCSQLKQTDNAQVSLAENYFSSEHFKLAI